MYSFFFFQAEDGIRYLTVTGVQTCALPISPHFCALRQQRRAAQKSFPSRCARPLDEPRTLRQRSEEHTSELQSQSNLVCRLLLEKKKNITTTHHTPPHI